MLVAWLLVAILVGRFTSLVQTEISQPLLDGLPDIRGLQRMNLNDFGDLSTFHQVKSSSVVFQHILERFAPNFVQTFMVPRG